MEDQNNKSSKFVIVGFLFGLIFYCPSVSLFQDISTNNTSMQHSQPFMANTPPSRVNFSAGDFTYYEHWKTGVEVGWVNETYSRHINDTHVVIDSDWDSGLGINNGNTTLNIQTRQIENETNGRWPIGYYYPWKIETNLSVGESVNIFTGLFLVEFETTYSYQGRNRVSWHVSNGSMNMFYDIDTGNLLELYSSDGLGFILNDTNQIPPGFHDVSINIGCISPTLINYPTSISFSISNEGTYSESVNYSILVNNSKVIEKQFNIQGGIGVAGWDDLNFTSVGWYNITAHVTTESGENDYDDNSETCWIEVVADPQITYNIGDYMAFEFSELIPFESYYINFTYHAPYDQCWVQLKMSENGTISYPMLNTVNREFQLEELSMMVHDFYYQISTHVSIGTAIPLDFNGMEIIDETIFTFHDVPMDAWVANISQNNRAYYHKDTGVLLGIANDTGLLLILTDTNMISYQPPTLISPGDISHEYNDSTFEVIWEAYDNHPTFYALECNGTTAADASWCNADNIIYQMGDNLPGIYVLNITVFNEGGFSTSDLITINIVDTTIPTVSSPDDLIIDDISQEYEISWNVSDLLPDHYQILLNGKVIAQGNWSVNDEIIFILSNHTLGEYEYELWVYDTAGNMASDIVQVIISKRTIGLPLYIMLSLISAQIVCTILFIVKKRRIK